MFIKTALLILGAWGALWGVPAAAGQSGGYIEMARPALPRGGAGTFQARWTNRVAKDPNDGLASFYNDRLTATGERLRPWTTTDLTCARPEASDLGACLMVSYGDRTIRCRVNDIGPAKHLHRAIDLTPAGFRLLGLRPKDGLGSVSIRRCR